MSNFKAALKAAKAALDAQNFPEAAIQANTVLATDPKNYFGYCSSISKKYKQYDLFADNLAGMCSSAVHSKSKESNILPLMHTKMLRSSNLKMNWLGKGCVISTKH